MEQVNKDSILDSVKKMLGVSQEYDVFDADIIIHINTVLSNLIQMGVGPKQGFVINGKDAVWTDFINKANLEQIKSYVYLKVRLLFDPPSNGTLLESMNNTAKELEYRLYIEEGGY